MHDRLTELLGPVAGLFHVDSVEAMALRILGAVLVLLAALWISGTVQRYLVRRLQRQNTGGAQAIHTYRQIVQAVVWVIGGAIALHTPRRASCRVQATLDKPCDNMRTKQCWSFCW